MATRKPRTKSTVRIYPVPGRFVPPGDFTPPILSVEQDVDQDTWDKLATYTPPAFTTTPPVAEDAPEEGGLTDG